MCSDPDSRWYDIGKISNSVLCLIEFTIRRKLKTIGFFIMKKYIQYGCGLDNPDGWGNYDASPTLRIQKLPVVGAFAKKRAGFPGDVKYGDIVKGLPLGNDSVDVVYCSHVLEHLSLSAFEDALKNTYKILKPGGVFRLVLPDFRVLVDEYINNESELAAVSFMCNTGMASETRNRGFKGFLVEWLGNSRHLWLWDYPSLRKYLKDTGFTEIRRAYFGDSSDSIFNSVENHERWTNALGIECVKPQ